MLLLVGAGGSLAVVSSLPALGEDVGKLPSPVALAAVLACCSGSCDTSANCSSSRMGRCVCSCRT
eukprot:1138418-Pelagomonas_calceolata.AAC.3